MAVKVEDVPVWLILDRKIGHAVWYGQHGWYHTACGTLTPNGETTEELPARICRKCRERLKEARLTMAGAAN